MSAEKFETLLARLDGLYQRDPEQFDRIRLELIERTIDGFDPAFRRRARGIQFMIDARLDRRSHPVARLNEMRALFWAQFDEFQRTLNDPFTTREHPNGREKDGTVIPLVRPRKPQ